jgi:hypothetical protein
MSRVERTENPSERRGNEHLRQAERGRRGATPRKDPSPGTTPGKAEGEEQDVEQALDRQPE